MSQYSGDKGYQAFRILQFVFVVAPILAGLDKFFGTMTDWTHYIAPQVSTAIQHHDKEFMQLVGIVEIIAGIGVALKPRIFSYIVFLWLAGIIVNLVLTHQYYDIALRDLGLCLAALALGRLSHKYSA